MDLGLTGRVVIVVCTGDRERAACVDLLEAEGALPLSCPRMQDVLAEDWADADALVVYLSRYDGPAADGVDPAELYRAWAGVEETGVALATVLPYLAERGWGRVVTVLPATVKDLGGTRDERDTLVGLGVLGMNKAAVAEVARKGIAVNAVLRDPSTAPEETAATVAFLLSDGAGYLQGVTMSLSGGTSTAVF